jgi:hypothetical protein
MRCTTGRRWPVLAAGTRSGLWRRNRPFRLPALPATLSECPDRALISPKPAATALASACCPTIFTSRSSLGRVSAARRGNDFETWRVTDDWPARVPVTDAEIDIFTELNRRATEADLRLKRLYDAIKAGVADLGDPALKERIASLTALRDQAQADAERAQALAESSAQQAIPRHGRQVRENCPRADQDRWGRLSSGPSPHARRTSRGHGSRGPHHGIERRPAQNPCRRLGCKIGYARRSEFCSKVAGHDRR